MAKNPKVTFDTSMGDAQDKKVHALAVLIDEAVMPEVAALAEHKAEYQGGPFVVMHKVTTWLANKGFDLASLPDPKSEAGNNPAHYKARRISNGNERYVDAYFYDDIAEQLPTVIRHRKRIDVLKRSLLNKDNVKTDDIPEADKNKPPHTRMAEIRRLTNEISVGKNAIAGAFELFWQLREFSALDKVRVVISWALDENGELCNGADGRAFEVEKINNPIQIKSTLEGREDLDKKSFGVSQFCRINVAKAKEAVGGATYHALINTLKATPTADQPVLGNTNINTVETFWTVINSAAEYLRRIQEDETSKASWTMLHNKTQKTDTEGEDAFWNARYVQESLRSLTGSPRDDIRWQAMLNKRADKKTAA